MGGGTLMEETAYCFMCKDWKPVSEFNLNRSRRCGYQRQCRPCEKFLRRQSTKYPIPEGQVCGFIHCNELATHRDHNHHTGEFRDFLCAEHNVLLGKAGENIQQLLDGIYYLTTHETTD